MDLEKQARELAETEARRKGAIDSKAQADAELLVRIVQGLKPALPLICQRIEGGNGERLGIELIPARAETLLYSDGSFEDDPLVLVNRHNIRTMLETLVQAISKQTDARAKAGEKAQRYADKVRLILAMLRETL